MTFLTPLPAIIAAAVTLPTLLVLYFLKLRRRPVRVSSTMLWTARTRDLQVNVPFRWLRPSILLLLQLAILALFLLALARPAINMAGDAPARVVVLIDRSGSMSARDAGEPAAPVSRLDRARTDAARYVGDLLRGSGSTEVAVIAFAREPRVVSGFTSSAARVREALDAVTPSDQPGDLAGALKLAGTLLTSVSTDAGEGEALSAPPGRAVLFSDGGTGTGEPLALTGGEFRYHRVGGRQAAESTEGGGHDNIGIVGIAARRDHADPALVRVFIRLLSTLPQATAVPITLSLDGEAVERRAVEVAGGTPQGAPGESSFTLQARTTGAGVLVAAIGRPDALAADDAAAVVLAAAARPRIVLVIPDPAVGGGPPPGEGPEWLIGDVLRELEPRSLRVLGATVYEAALAGESGLSADLIVFDRVTAVREPPAPSLSFGGGVPGVELGAVLGGTPVLTWDRSHPVLRNASLDAVVVAQPREITGGGAFRELARGRSGPLVVQADRGAVRRVVAAFELAQSNWPLDPGFPIFVADAVDYLTLRGEDAAGGGGATFTTVQPAEVTVEAAEGGAGGRLTVRGPVEFTVPVPPGEDGPRRVNLGVLERAGVYEVEGGRQPRFVAVNMTDATESAIAVAPSLRVSGQTSSGDPSERADPREVWPWLVLAALVLLAVEWFAHAWLMRV